MAKLYFRYGAMNSGKSTALLQAAFNYEERGQQVILAKPELDTKGANQVVSRLGVTREVDVLFAAEDNAHEVLVGMRQALLERTKRDIACVLVDEAQFLTAEQIDQLMLVALLEGVPVIAYGIRSDFLTVAFAGSRRLLEIAHSIEELKTICRCGRKALFNARRIGSGFVFTGDQVAIDAGDVTYESLCGNCYLQESGGRLGH